MEEVITGLLEGVFVGLLFLYLIKFARKAPVKNMEGETVYKLPSFYKITGLIGIVFSAGLFIGAIFFYWDEILPAILLISILMTLGLILYLYGKNQMALVNPEYIKNINWKGNSKTIFWKDVQSIKFNALSGYLVIKSSSDKINCHFSYIGFPHLVVFIEKSTGISAEGMNLPAAFYKTEK